jgi:hypothetical protein
MSIDYVLDNTADKQSDIVQRPSLISKVRFTYVRPLFKKDKRRAKFGDLVYRVNTPKYRKLLC